MYDKRVMYFNQFLLAFSDTKATAETDEAGEGAGQQQEPQVEQQDEPGEELEGAVGGDPVGDLLGGVGANEEVEDDEDEDDDDKDNEYEDEYDAEEEAYLNQFINKDSVASKGQRANGVTKQVNFSEFVLIISFFTATSEEGQTSQIDSRQEKLC